MPPDPILALISFVGLCAYIVVGSVVAAGLIRKFGHADHAHALATRQFTGSIERRGRSYYNDPTHYAYNVWWLFAFITLVWPAVLVVTVVAAVGFGLFWGPAWIASHTGSYVASIKSGEAA